MKRKIKEQKQEIERRNFLEDRVEKYAQKIIRKNEALKDASSKVVDALLEGGTLPSQDDINTLRKLVKNVGGDAAVDVEDEN